MGDVYLAVQTSLDRKVALKVLKSELAKDAKFVERFRDEARSAARLNHPNIVTVFDVGQEGDQHFLSMEYMDGSSLEERLQKSGPIPWRETLEILRDAAAGLVYAETSGIVHRDIKPENLMRNRDGVTKIADLGLAVQVEQESVDSEAGKVFGTPHFLAPEVVSGTPATASSDLYSLGATAYRVLSGHTPFEGRGAREILRSALLDDVPDLAARVPGLPAAMATTVHRLLSKKPEDRHPSAAILLAEIERLRQSDGKIGGAVLPEAQTAGLPKPLLIGGVLVAAAAAAFLIFGGGDDNEPTGADRFPTRDGGAGTDSSTAGFDGEGSGSTTPGPTGDAAIGDGSFDPGGLNAGGGDAATGLQDEAGGAEASYEYRANLAYLELGDENLTKTQRVARLRALGEAFAGTDTATQALVEATSIEGAAASVAASDAAATSERTSMIDALRTAAGLDQKPFLPGNSVVAMQGVAEQINLAGDLGFIKARNQLIDEVMQIGLLSGRAAMDAADEASAAGDFMGTREPLEAFIKSVALPTTEEASILADDGVPNSVAELRTLVSAIQGRLDGMAGSEAEFEANRLSKQRSQVGSLLADGLEQDLAGFAMGPAARRLEDAAKMTSEEPLHTLLAERAADLRSAETALAALVQGWDTPGWRRQSVLDPRDGSSGSIEIVGIANGIPRVTDGGVTQDMPFASWCGHTGELENLFLGRLDRDYTAEESRGIATLLGISATLETLRSLEPAIGITGLRVSPDNTDAITAPFDEALDWARNAESDLGDELRVLLGKRTLVEIIQEQRRAARMLTEALIARDQGRWDASAERLERLLQERREAWLVMMLSKGGAQ